MLELISITKSFMGPQSPVTVLSDLSLSVESGEFVSIQGASGSGKSTLLLAAGAMEAPNSGKVMLNGTDLYALSSEARTRFRGQHIGFVFQQFYLIPYLNVMENILAAGSDITQEDNRQRATMLMEQFGISHRAHHLPSALSIGEKQRTSLARALFHQPELILADEPTGNLDEKNSDLVLEALKRFTENGGAVLMVTHSDRAAKAADRCIRLKGGKA